MRSFVTSLVLIVYLAVGNTKLSLPAFSCCKPNANFSFDNQYKVLAMRGGASVGPITPETVLTVLTVIGGVSAFEMLLGQDFNLLRFWRVPTQNTGGIVKALGRPFGAYLLGFSLLLYVFRDAIGVVTALQWNMATQILHMLVLLYDKFITKSLNNNEALVMLVVMLVLQAAVVL